MGQKISKNSITVEDLSILCKLSGKTEIEVKEWSDDFFKICPSGKLDKEQFVEYYKHFRHDENVDEIAKYCFRAFDLDRNGFVDFGEFLISYVATTGGDPREKLTYAFNVYDEDNNKVLDESEIRLVMKAMFLLLSINSGNVDFEACMKNIMNSLDVNRDKKISIGEFIEGIMEDSVLQALMSPFPLGLDTNND
jgi:Ca2+-binding EF-hand superfamily protein